MAVQVSIRGTKSTQMASCLTIVLEDSNMLVQGTGRCCVHRRVCSASFLLLQWLKSTQ
jgi:hypothetical protein